MTSAIFCSIKADNFTVSNILQYYGGGGVTSQTSPDDQTLGGSIDSLTASWPVGSRELHVDSGALCLSQLAEHMQRHAPSVFGNGDS